MSGRAATILSRFPNHLEADAPGKLFDAVVGGLANDLDVQTGQVGDIRRAHRLPDAPTLDDVLRLAALHGLRAPVLEPVRLRLTAAGAVSPARALEHHRATVGAVVAVARTGNGTPVGLLGAAAAYLGLAIADGVDTTDDRWWHLAACTDRLAEDTAAPDEDDLGANLLALEENPFRAADVEPGPRRHGELFGILRGGLEAVPVTVVVAAADDRTVAPMVVNVDTGSGVAFTGAVPSGAELRFWADGRVTLDDASVARLSYSFRGAVFADAAAANSNDFVFADEATPLAGPPPRPVDGVLPHHVAFWSITEPADDTFSSDASLPHPEGVVEPVWLRRGRTRWRAFVGTGAFALRWRNGSIRSAAPRYAAGFFDRSLFAVEPASPPSLAVGFEWQEREPFAVRVWIPMRFEELDEEGETPLRERLRALLDRHRAAGVRLTVAYADPRWTLGTGIIRNLDATDPRGLVVTGTGAWPDDTTQPPPT